MREPEMEALWILRSVLKQESDMEVPPGGKGNSNDGTQRREEG